MMAGKISLSRCCMVGICLGLGKQQKMCACLCMVGWELVWDWKNNKNVCKSQLWLGLGFKQMMVSSAMGRTNIQRQLRHELSKVLVFFFHVWAWDKNISAGFQ